MAPPNGAVRRPVVLTTLASTLDSPKPAVRWTSRALRARRHRHEDPESGRSRHALAQVEPGLGRLVVSDVLPRHRQAVLAVVHQGRQPVLGRDLGRVDPQLLVVDGAPDDLFPPVAEDVGAEARGGLRPVVGRAVPGNEQGGFGARLPVPLGDAIAVEDLAWVRDLKEKAAATTCRRSSAAARRYFGWARREVNRFVNIR